MLLPVPPEHGDEAEKALAAAVNDEEQVEISVMLARERDGEPVSVVFGSVGALVAWAPLKTGNLPLPGRIAIAGFDDLDILQHTVPRLTCLRLPRLEIGRRGAEALLARIRRQDAGPVRLDLGFEVIQREST